MVTYKPSLAGKTTTVIEKTECAFCLNDKASCLNDKASCFPPFGGTYSGNGYADFTNLRHKPAMPCIFRNFTPQILL